MHKLLRGVGSKEDHHLIDSRRVFNAVRGIVQARVSDLDSLLVKSFTPVDIALCKIHEADGFKNNPGMTRSGICQKCIEA